MPAHKVILRLDFDKPKFAVLDAAGGIMQLMTDEAEIKWADFRHEMNGGGVSGNFTDKEGGCHQQISMQPNNLNFLLEDSKGIELSKMDLHRPLNDLFKVTHALCKEFQISGVKRAGLRFIMLSDAGTPEAGEALFANSINPDFQGLIGKALGAPKDFGLAIDGIAEDKLAYHFRAGPMKEVNVDTHFAVIGKSLKEGPRHSMILDLDFFEENFLLTVRARKWADAAVRKAMNLSSQLEDMMFAVSQQKR